MVIAWIRQTDPGIIPIIAGSSMKQVDDNVAATSLRLNDEQMERLTTAGNPDVKRAWLQPT